MRRYIKFNRKRQKESVEWKNAPDVKKRVVSLIAALNLTWVKKARIYSFRSRFTNTYAIARIWGLSRIWQLALKIPPTYIIEVISERYDELSEMEKDKVLLHEITHIPKNFSGSLMPHIRRGKHSFHSKVDELISQYLRLGRRNI